MKKQLSNFTPQQLHDGAKLIFKLFILLTLTFGSEKILAQKNTWHLFQPNADCKNIQFTSSPGLGSDFPQNYDDQSNTFNDYIATNVATDDNGKLLFTVISTLHGIFLYDINNQLVYDHYGPYFDMLTPNVGSKEIAIVPINKGVKYHIITSGLIWEYDIAKAVVSQIESYGAVVLTPHFNS
jgi:hypothetical protein